MALWAAGWSYLLLALFYLLIDVAGFRRWAFPFVVIGMNAIAIYVVWDLLNPFPPMFYYWILGFSQYAAGRDEWADVEDSRRARLLVDVLVWVRIFTHSR